MDGCMVIGCMCAAESCVGGAASAVEGLVAQSITLCMLIQIDDYVLGQDGMQADYVLGQDAS
jgi:hypothetical protein